MLWYPILGFSNMLNKQLMLVTIGKPPVERLCNGDYFQTCITLLITCPSAKSSKQKLYVDNNHLVIQIVSGISTSVHRWYLYVRI